MSQDMATWIKVSSKLYLNEKVQMLSEANPSAVIIWVLSITYSADQKTGGFISDFAARRFIGTSSDDANQLTEYVFWNRVDGGWRINTLGLFSLNVHGHTGRPHIPDGLRRKVYERDGYKCVRCGATDHLSLDHIWPWSLGGKDEESNLQTLCRSCNSRKGANPNG